MGSSQVSCPYLSAVYAFGGAQKAIFNVLIFAMLGVVFVCQPAWAEQLGPPAIFTVTALGEPLRSVCEKISAATGYEIVVNQEWEDYPIVAVIHDQTLTNGLGQMMKGLDFALIEDSSKGKIRVLIFADRNSVKAGVNPSEIENYRASEGYGIDKYAEEYTKRQAKSISDVIIANNVSTYAEQ